MRHALFSSARKDLVDSKKYYGNGTLKAADALQVKPKTDTNPIPEDEVYLPYLSLFYGWETIDGNDINKDMVAIEMAQLEQGNPDLRKFLENVKNATSVDEKQKEALRAHLRKIPEASQALIDAIK